MAIARQTTAKLIRPIDGARVQRYTYGATIAAGELVTLSSDGKIDPADETSALQKILGVAIKAGVDGDAGMDVVVHGRCECITGGTPGASVYGSDTAGEPSETVGSNTAIAGFVDRLATVLFVRPSAAL